MKTDVSVRVDIPKGVSVCGVADSIYKILASIGCHVISLSADNADMSFKEEHYETKIQQER